MAQGGTARNPITLAFRDPALESHFREVYFQKILVLGRVCHLLAVFFYGAFALWDTGVMAPQRVFIWSVVFSAVLLMFALGLILSFARRDIYQKIWQPLYACYVLGTGLGFTVISVWAGPAYFKLYVGIIYCLIFNFAVIRLRFIWAAWAGWIIVLIYLAGLAFFRDPDIQMLGTEAFMLSGITFLGMFVSYSMELSARQDFLLNLSLEKAKQAANDVSSRLEKMVQERTRQLSAANESLRSTIAREREVSGRLVEEEKVLQRNLASLQQAEQIASLGYWERNWQADADYWSPGFHRLFGWEVGGVRPSPGNFIKQVHPEDAEWVSTRMNDLVQHDIPFNIEFRARHASGRELFIHGVAATTRDRSGAPLLTQGTFQDITAARELKDQHDQLEQRLRQAQKMEAIGTLAGGIAHDFNNILAAITGYAELALEHAEDGSPPVQSLQQILEASGRAAKLIRQILTFSRKMESMLAPVDLNREISETVGLLQTTIPRMIAIDLDLSPDICLIEGDATQIQQMLLNLASNARDALPDGGRIGFHTSLARVEAAHCQICQGEFSGEYVLMSVSDNGQGMDEETLEKIFDPFFTTKEVGKGTGLGLATVFGIVSSHGAHAQVISRPGRGTVFNIYLPIPAEPLEIGSATEEPDQLSHGSETVLLVDDEPHILDLGRRFLGRNGYTVLLAENGEQALEIFGDTGEKIDLVILDLSMPGMGGRQCLRKMLDLKPDQKVIVATGYSRDGDLKEVISSGIAALLQKPFSKNELLGMVRTVLDA